MKKLLTVLFATLLSLNSFAQEIPICERDPLEKVTPATENKILSYKNNDLETVIGGAARLTYTLSDADEAQMIKGGDLKYDVFYITALARYKNFSMHAEYRLYAENNGGGMLNNAYIQYQIEKTHFVQFGLMKVPFGNLSNSNSFYFSLAYYVGLESDDDAGIKYSYINEHIQVDAAFFKNSDMNRGSGNTVDPSRFSFDVMGQNQETNQGNLRVIGKFGNGNVKHQIGASGMYGGLYNIYTQEMGSHHAMAAHYHMTAGDFQLRAQLANYSYDPKNLADSELSEGQISETPNNITMGAYGSTYLVADKGTVYTASAMYNIPYKNRDFFSSINVYLEYNMLDKADKNFDNSHMYLLGANVNIWKMSIYAEYIVAKNQPFLNNDWTTSLGPGDPNAEWTQRLNINFGFYF